MVYARPLTSRLHKLCRYNFSRSSNGLEREGARGWGREPEKELSNYAKRIPRFSPVAKPRLTQSLQRKQKTNSSKIYEHFTHNDTN